MRNLLFITMLLGVGYSQCGSAESECDPDAEYGYNCDCNESTWSGHYPDMEGCYLPCADLSVLDLGGADLSFANLEYAQLEGSLLYGLEDGSTTNLAGANLTRANLAGVGAQFSNFEGANLQEANLWGINLYQANCQGANFTGAIIIPVGQGSLDEANFEDANLTGAQMGHGLQFYNNTLYARDSNFRNANLQFANLGYTDFEGSDFTGANFSYAHMVKAHLGQADLEGACMENALMFYPESFGMVNEPPTYHGEFLGTPIYEGCGINISEDTDGDGYDDVSYDAGAESVDVGDMNDDGTNNVLDVVLLINDILLTP